MRNRVIIAKNSAMFPLGSSREQAHRPVANVQAPHRGRKEEAALVGPRFEDRRQMNVLRIAIRAFVPSDLRIRRKHALLFEDLMEGDPATLILAMERLYQKHAAILASHPLRVVELEFLDERDPLKRFYRVERADGHGAPSPDCIVGK
jgi:hypothetical protein